MKQFSLEEYLKNPSRRVVTRDGREARIICTDKLGKFPIGALIKEGKNEEDFHTYTLDGGFFAAEEDDLDLFFATEKYERQINLYKDGDIVYASMDTFNTKKEAEVASCSTCVATVKIEWEE